MHSIKRMSAAFLAALLLTGCTGDDQPADVTDTTESTPGTTTTTTTPDVDEFALTTTDGLTPNQVEVATTELAGQSGVAVKLAAGIAGGDQPTVAVVDGIALANGTIEVDLAGDTLDPANGVARGFTGIMFRLAPDLSSGEGIYLRPLNAVDPDPERHERVLQYFSYPDFPFSVSRAQSPGVYEKAASVAPSAWTHLRIELDGTTAEVFVGDATEPDLTVSDLKLGADASGGVGLWVDQGSVATFANLTVTQG